MAGRTYGVKLHDEAEKQLARQDRKMRERIVAKLSALGSNPRPAGVEQVTGREGVLRLRLGGLRVLYRIDEVTGVVSVVGITPRGQVYKGRRLQRL
jgi:mRNA interferase RelE/StbE